MKKFLALGMLMFALVGGSFWSTAFEKPLRTAENELSMQSRLAGHAKWKVSGKASASKSIKKVASNIDIDNLKGGYVMNYSSVVYLEASGGKYCEIEPIAGTDSITIKNFWDNGITVKAKVDAMTGVLEIPNQVVTSITDLGDVDVAVCKKDGKPDRNTQITGSVKSDGTIAIDGWWGLFYKTGRLKDLYLAAYDGADFEKSNATMSYTDSKGNTTSFGVVYSQLSKNIVKVKNFANFGQTVEIILNTDRSGIIESQNVREYPRNGNFMTFGVGSWSTEDEPQPEGVTKNITLQANSDNRTLSWGNWTAVSQGDDYLYIGALTSGKIQTTEDIEYPSAPPSAFEGDGSQSNPYIIKTVDDFVLLSEKVNGGEKYLNKYFKLLNDVDMANFRFTPIGNSENVEFSGIFDGNNKTVSNINISTASTGYAGLFGLAGESSVIKNLSIKSAIVKSEYNFNGTIVGWSKGSIENCHVEDAHVESTGSVTGGLAGEAVTISGSSISNSEVYGLGGYSGGLAGEVSSLISGSNATGVVVYAGSSTALFPSGGLVGTLQNAKAKDCYFAGSLDGRTHAKASLCLGGVIGACTLGEIENCFSTGTIIASGSDAVVGGVVGSLSGAVLKNSYSTGLITSPSSTRSGGLAGWVRANSSTGKQSTVESCYTATSLDAETSNYDPQNNSREIIGLVAEGSTPTIKDIYYDKQLTNYRSTKYGVATSKLVSASGVEGFDASIWTFAKDQYPMIKSLSDNEAAKTSVSSIIMTEGNSLGKLAANAELHAFGNTEFFLYNNGQLAKEGHFSGIDGNVLKIKEEFGTDTLVVKNGNLGYVYYVKVAPVPFEGEGKEVNPFLIKTKEDLIKLASITNDSKQYFADTYFKMTNDIDLEHSTDFKGICANGDDSQCRFSGTFDGDRHTLHNLKLDAVAWSTAPEDSENGLGTPDVDNVAQRQGFIGKLASDGVLKNLSIANDAQLSFWASSAPFVGYCWGRVENCRNYADVVGQSSWIGGIVGYLEGGVVTNCYNEGNIVSGLRAVGGIAGVSVGQIEGSMNVGTVEAKVVSTFSSGFDNVGGIVGQSLGASYKNVVNAGNVSGSEKVGGISGSIARESGSDVEFHNDLENTINYGMVKSTDPLLRGGIGGESGTRGKIKNVFYDSQILPMAANANTGGNGMKGLETSTLTKGEPLDGFDTKLWSFEAGKYPVLSSFKDENKVTLARNAVVSMESGASAKNVTGKTTLSQADGISWSLKVGKEFSIADGSLTAPDKVTSIVADTLVATASGYVKEIPLRRVYDVPLNGLGTETSPYEIASASDWNQLASYISATGMTFKGKFLKVMNDFSFEGNSLSTLSNDEINHFDGTLDGNSKTISEISYTTTDEGQSVIGTLGENSVVRDLTIEGNIQSEFANTGGFSSGVYGTLSNCVNKVNVTSTKGDGTSGFGIIYGTARLSDVVNKAAISGKGSNIAGLASESEEGAEFVRCGNVGDIVNNGTKNYTAGLVGTANPGRFIECYNTGKVAANESASNIAGLVAYATAESGSIDKYVFDQCYNTSDIISKTVAGGLVATSSESSSVYNPMSFNKCYNTGAVTTKGSAFSGAATGGIIALYTAGSEFLDCYNTGNVTAEKSTYAAGIAGAYKWKTVADSVRVLLKRCYNTGDIAANGNLGGGIVGSTPDYITVDSCYNVGNISGKFALGGIAANLNSADAILSNCWNAGNVTTSMNRAAGIVGWNNKAAQIINCFNVGDITNTSKGYGTGGIAGQGGAIFTNCYNMGTLTGNNEVGGIVGETFKGLTQLIGCYNAGKIVAPADTCGGLIGLNINQSRYWSDGNKVENSYYVTDFGTFENDKLGEATTIAALAKADLGKAWIAGDDYTLPILASISDCDYAKLNAAAIILSGEDSLSKVTQNFHVGSPEGLTWTSSQQALSVSGNDATFTDKFTGELVLTATIGELTKEYTLNCEVSGLSGVQTVETAHGKLVSERFFNPAGLEISRPSEKTGSVYIVVRKYDDGYTSVVKIIR